MENSKQWEVLEPSFHGGFFYARVRNPKGATMEQRRGMKDASRARAKAQRLCDAMNAVTAKSED